MESTLPEFAKSLFDRFESEGIPLLLAGGWAVSAHGFPRNTLDIDWICSRSHESAASELMETLGFEPRSDGMATRFQYGHDLSCPMVDLIWVNEDSFAKMRGEVDPVMRVRTVSFRGLIAMKLFALKDDEHRKGRDLRDLQELLQRNPGEIPEEELKSMCLKYAGEWAFDSLRLSQ